MAAYINGMGAISPQKSWVDEGMLLPNPIDYHEASLGCVEPDYTQYIDPKHLRRMSRILKMGMTASLLALKDAGISVPDGIITGTGYGCLEDTGIFMKKMIVQKEQTLNPTPFIQSTHNTIGSQIALLLGCQGYNQTYTQEAFSFENSLLDASLHLREYPGQTILVGGVDEITEFSLDIQKRFGIYKRAPVSSLDLFKTTTRGTLAGEGAFYFALSGKKSNEHSVSIDAVETLFNLSKEELTSAINQFVASNGLKMDEIDLVMAGKSGDRKSDLETEALCKSTFGEFPIGMFKHLCGEFSTASAFALWLATRIIQGQHIPSVVIDSPFKHRLKNILIYNPYFQKYHSLILLRSC